MQTFKTLSDFGILVLLKKHSGDITATANNIIEISNANSSESLAESAEEEILNEVKKIKAFKDLCYSVDKLETYDITEK